MLTPQQIQSVRMGAGLDKTSPQQNYQSEDISSAISRLQGQDQISQTGQPSYFSQVGKGIGQTFSTGAQDITKAYENASDLAQKAGGGVIPDILAGYSAAGKTAGTVAKTAGGILGSFISPLLPDPVKQAVGNVADYFDKKISSIPGMTPEIHQALGDVFNTVSLLGGEEIKPVAKQTAQVAGDIASAGASKAINVAKDIGQKGAESITDIASKPLIEPSVQTELTKGAAENNVLKQEQILNRYKEYSDQAQKAVADNSQATPLEMAGNKAEEALSKLKEQMNEAGQAKQQALKESGSKLVDTRPTLDKFGNLLKERLGTAVDSQGNLVDSIGRKSVIKNSASDTKLIGTIRNTLLDLGKKPTLQEVNDAVDSIQGELYKSGQIGAEPINTKTESVAKQIIGDLNNQAKEIGGEGYKNANAKYADLADTYHILNKGLGIDANKGASLMKQLFSPGGTMARKLFADIKDKTGIDLVNEATLAKHAMENAGDVRQSSLLQKVITGEVHPSKAGITQYIADKTIKKMQNPSATAQRIAEKALREMKK